MGRSPDGRIVARFSLKGAGTREDPAVLHFHLGNAWVESQVLRDQLPPTVTLELAHPFGYNMKAVDPAMSRSDLDAIFRSLVKKMHWRTRSFA